MPNRRQQAAEPLLVVDVSLGDPSNDYDELVTYLGREARIVRMGTDGRIDEALALVSKWADHAQAIAITGVHDARATGNRAGDVARLTGLDRTPNGVPVVHGDALRDTLQEWAIRKVQTELAGYFTNARVVVLSATNHECAMRILREYTPNITGTRPAVGDLLGGLEQVPFAGRIASIGLWPARRLPERVQSILRLRGPLARSVVQRAARGCDVIVATYDELAELGVTDLHGKAVVTSAITDEQLAELARRDVDLVVDDTPQPFAVTVDAAVLEALSLLGSPGSAALSPDGLLDTAVAAGLEPRVLRPNGPRRKSRFAFIIHPLSQQHFANVEPLRTMSKVAPGVVMDAVEKGVAYVPPFIYSHVTGIRSPDGAEAEGWLITVGGTPSQLMAHSPEFTYSRLLEAVDIAQKLGAQIVGLGAFTKVVGDAGVTVARRAPLPVTTGNSYSASATLWAAREAMRRLGLVEVGADGVMHVKAMVVGATGSIGSVCARLLALATDEVWLVSPESAKLLALKQDIEKHAPRAAVHIAATSNGHLSEMDLIVTATSAAGRRVLDIMDVKPGCVITDVARPLDLSPEDVARRPDVLVIESGEIELPGDVRMKTVGLPPGVAYACLAETVVLALEGRFETFTVGRDISWERVKEIYQLGLKHGMKLATVSGVNGVFTDADIAQIRDRALAARQ